MDRKVLEVSSLSLSFSDYLPTYLSIFYRSIYLSVYLSICLSVDLSIYLSIYPSIYLSILLSISLSVYKPMYLSLKIFFKCPTPASIFGNATKPSRFAHFCQGAKSLAPATRSDIWTSKSAPYPSVFCTFDLEICFATQRRALFRHLNVQKWSENGVFCTFWLRNVLRTTTACTFSTSQLPKVVRHWGVLYIFTSKCASRHNGVRISTSKSVPRPRCFVPFHLEMCFAPQRRAIFDLSSGPAGSAPAALASLLFDPPELQIIRKNTVFCEFPTFPRTCIFFLLTLSLLLFSLLVFLFALPLPYSAFHLSILSEVWLLNFLRLVTSTSSSTSTSTSSQAAPRPANY